MKLLLVDDDDNLGVLLTLNFKKHRMSLELDQAESMERAL